MGKGRKEAQTHCYNTKQKLSEQLLLFSSEEQEKIAIAQKCVNELMQNDKAKEFLYGIDACVKQVNIIIQDTQSKQNCFQRVLDETSIENYLNDLNEKTNKIEDAIAKMRAVINIYQDKRVYSDDTKAGSAMQSLLNYNKLCCTRISIVCRVIVYCLYSTGQYEKAAQMVKNDAYKNAFVFKPDEKSYIAVNMLSFFAVASILEREGFEEKANKLRIAIIDHDKKGVIIFLRDSDGTNGYIIDKAYAKLLKIAPEIVDKKDEFGIGFNDIVTEAIKEHLAKLAHKMREDSGEAIPYEIFNDLSCDIGKAEKSKYFSVQCRGHKAIKFLDSLFNCYPAIREVRRNKLYANICYSVGLCAILLRDKIAIDMLMKLDKSMDYWDDAQILMAELYSFGVCTNKKIYKTISLCEEVVNNKQHASDRNYFISHKVLGDIYFLGEGGEKNIDLAVSYFEKAIELATELKSHQKLSDKDFNTIIILLSKAYFQLYLDKTNAENLTKAFSMFGKLGSDKERDAAFVEFGVMMAQHKGELAEQGLKIIQAYDVNNLAVTDIYNIGTCYLDCKKDVEKNNFKKLACRAFKKIVMCKYQKSLKESGITNNDILTFLRIYEDSCANWFVICKMRIGDVSLETSKDLDELENAIEEFCEFLQSNLRCNLALDRAVTHYIYKLLALKDEVCDFKDMNSSQHISVAAERTSEAIILYERSITEASDDSMSSVSPSASGEVKTVSKTDVLACIRDEGSLQGKMQSLHGMLDLLVGDVSLDIDTFSYLAENLGSLFAQTGPDRKILLINKLSCFFNKAAMLITNAAQESWTINNLLALTSSICSMHIAPDDKLVHDILKKSYQLIANRSKELSFWQIVRIVHISAKAGIADDYYEDFSVIMEKLLSMLQKRQAGTNIKTKRLTQVQQDIHLLYKLTALINSVQQGNKLHDTMLSISNNLRRSIEADRELLLEQSDEKVFLSLVSCNVITRFFGKDLGSLNLDAADNFLQEASKKTEKLIEQLVHTSATQMQVFDLLKICLKDKLNNGYSLREEVSLAGLSPEDICLYKGEKLLAILKVDGAQHNLFAGKGDISSLQPARLTPKDRLRDTVLAKLFPEVSIMHIPVTKYANANDRLQWLQDNVVSRINLANSKRSKLKNR